MPYSPAPTAVVDPDLIHSSARTALTTNAVADGTGLRVTLRVARLELRWNEGDLAVRFSAQEADVTPRRRTASNQPQIRGRTC